MKYHMDTQATSTAVPLIEFRSVSRRFGTNEILRDVSLAVYPGETLVVSKIGPRLKSATLLSAGTPLSLEHAANGRTVIRGLPESSPDPLATVIKVEFEGPPHAVTQIDADWLDGAFEPSDQ